MADDFAWYRAAREGKVGPISADHPQCGYFKVRDGKNSPWLPVAIWRKDGELVCRVANQWRDPLKIWTFAADNHVDKDHAKIAFETGKWPDMPAERPKSNMPADPFDALMAEIEDKQAQASELLNSHAEIKSQTVCDLFRNMQAQLLALNKRADAMHKEEKAPALEQCRTIDEKFGFRGAVKVLSERLRSRFETFMKVEERRQQEEARKKFEAERAAAEAERKRLEAERAKKLEDDPIAALTETPPEMPELPLAPEPVKIQSGGGFGRKAGLKSVWVPVMTDYSKALAHFAENAKVKELVQKLAEQAVKAGARDLPGFDVKEDRRAA